MFADELRQVLSKIVENMLAGAMRVVPNEFIDPLLRWIRREDTK